MATAAGRVPAGLTPLTGPQTAALIADQLRELIVEGAFRPGEQVGEASLAGGLQVSRGPVREALQRLAQEGLVVSRRNRGMFVVELTPRDVAEIYSARAAVELAAADDLAGRPDPERAAVAARLRAIIGRMPGHVRSGDWPSVARADLQFHSTLVARTGNSRLTRTYATLAAETRICMLDLERAYLRPQDLPQEHHRLTDLLEAGEAAALQTAIRAHLSTAVDDLQRLMRDRAARPDDTDAARPSAARPDTSRSEHTP
ncbi:GntR family transcriptional regulator [Tomitella cavernea]|uniref:GntR family transcriptional regulator n=1 Tax=Tomitella cavernea TaxID=1387982 RepID=A0ABP9D456_9ACTN|nr:GntR family transcriptional regulator [Tomitella cavernea]